jgi:histone H3/H4
MSSSGTKRARATDKDGGKRRSRSVASKKKDAGKPRRKTTDKKRSTDKKRRSPASSSGKKDSRSKSKSTKSTKKVKEDDGEKKVKEVKESARKIQVEWRPRMKFDDKTGEKVIDIKTGKQKYGWAVRTQPFRRLVNHYAREMTEKSNLPDMRLAAHVTKAIQSAVEEEMVEILHQAAMMALHAKRTTVQKQDVSMISRLQKPLDIQEVDKTYSLVLSKRSSKVGSGEKRAPSVKRAKKAADTTDNKDAKDAATPAVAAADGIAAAPAKKKAAPKKSKKSANSDAAASLAVTDAFPIAASA